MQSKKFQVLFLAGTLLSSEVDGIKRGRRDRSAQSDDSCSSEMEILPTVFSSVDNDTNTFSIEVEQLREFSWREWAFGSVEIYQAKVFFSGGEREVEFRYSEKKKEYEALQKALPDEYPNDFPSRPTSGCCGWSWHSDRVDRMHTIFNEFFNSNRHVIEAFWRKKFFTEDVLTKQDVIVKKLLELEDQFSKIKGSSALNMLKGAASKVVSDDQFSALSQVVETFKRALESVCHEEQILSEKIAKHEELMKQMGESPIPVQKRDEARRLFGEAANALQSEYNSFFDSLNDIEKSEDVFEALTRIVEDFNQKMRKRNPFDHLHVRSSDSPKFYFDRAIQHAQAFVAYLQKMQASYALIPELNELQNQVTKKFAKCKPYLPAKAFDDFLGESLFEEVLDYNESSSWKIVPEYQMQEKIKQLEDTLGSGENPFVEQLHLDAIKSFARDMASYSERQGNFDPTRLFAGPKERSEQARFSHSVVLDRDSAWNKTFKPLSSDTKISVRGDEIEPLALDQILRSDFLKATWPDISKQVDDIKAAFDADRDILKQIVKKKTYLSSMGSGVEHLDKDMEDFNIENLVFGSFTHNWLFQTYFKYASKQFSTMDTLRHPDQKARWQARTQILKSLCHQSLLLWIIREMDTEFWAKLAHSKDLSEAQAFLRETNFLVEKFKEWALAKFQVTISDGDRHASFQKLRDDFLASEYFSAYQAYFKSLMPKLHTYVQKSQQFDDSTVEGA
jgi:hypothetical protein